MKNAKTLLVRQGSLRYSYSMRSLLIMLIGLVFGTAMASEVYRWVDRNGQVHFSDRPQAGAEVVEIKQSKVVQQRPAPRASAASGSSVAAPASSTDEPEPNGPYRLLAINSPAQEEVLWNIGGQLDVALQLEPSLMRGHSIELSLDGQVVSSLPSLRAELSEVYRGVHVLTATVVDRKRAIIIESAPVRFTVQQSSLLNRPGG